MGKKKVETNLDLVKDLMHYSPYGALCQAFIIEGIYKYCDTVIKENPLTENSFVDHKAWLGIANDIKTRMDSFYKRET